MSVISLLSVARRSISLTVFFAAICAGGFRMIAQSRGGEADDVQFILDKIGDEDANTRATARNKLADLSHGDLSVEDGIRLLRGARNRPSTAKERWEDTAARLISAVSQKPRSEYIAVTVECYPNYSPHGKAAGLELLTRSADREAAVAYVKLLKTHEKANDMPAHSTRGWQDKPRHADVLFPELYQYADQKKFRWELFLLCLRYCEERAMPDDSRRLCVDPAVKAYQEESKLLAKAQRPNGIAWMWAEKYAGPREMGALLLDLFGYLPDQPDLVRELQSALKFHDPKLKYFAAVSLLRIEKAVEPDVISDIAASNEMRASLYDALKRIDRADLFPKKYHTQAALAESNMVQWLIYPTELGRVPDEIELMKVVSGDTLTKDGIIDYYLFRFRTLAPHWAAKDGWIAGVSGPFRRKEEPTTNALGGTFSRFNAWDKKTPEEHVDDIKKTLDEWYKHWAEKGGK